MIHGRYLAQLIAHQLAMGTTHDGGKGSGDFGHAGRPGEIGGSYSHAQIVSAEHHITDLPVLHGGWRANCECRTPHYRFTSVARRMARESDIFRFGKNY